MCMGFYMHSEDWERGNPAHSKNGLEGERLKKIPRFREGSL